MIAAVWGTPARTKGAEPTMQERRIDGLIFALLVLSTAAAVLSSLERPNGFLKQARSLMYPGSVTGVTIAAGALRDVRYLDVPP